MFGEKINEVFVKNILNEHLNTEPFFFFAPEYVDEKYQYHIYVETDKDLSDIQDKIEKRLKSNFHYNYAVEIGQLLPLKVMKTRNGNDKYLKRCQEEFNQRLGDIKQTSFSNKIGWLKFFKEEN